MRFAFKITFKFENVLNYCVPHTAQSKIKPFMVSFPYLCKCSNDSLALKLPVFANGILFLNVLGSHVHFPASLDAVAVADGYMKPDDNTTHHRQREAHLTVSKGM